MAKRIKAVMMAGGFGTRIQPLTNSIPKPMLPIVNLPMMEHTLNKLIETGIKEVVILLYFKPEIIKNYFGDGSKWGVTIHYVLPDDDYGTAGAVGFGREYLDTTFMIVSGDLVTDFDFKKILKYHKEKRSKLTITLTSVENPLQFGVVIANEEGKIEKFLEKPSWGEVFSDTINTGIYIMEPEILDYIPVGENYDFAKDLFPLLMREGIDLMGYNATGYWRDVGNPDSYREVHDDILNRRLEFKMPGKKIDYPDGTLYLTGESEIDPSVEIIDTVIIGSNVSIGKRTRLHNVVIGDNVTLGSECRIRNSVFWHDITIGRKVVLDNAVICNDTRIGDGVSAKAGLILAEGCKVGKLVTFEQDVTVWPGKEIEPAAIVNNNVVWGTRYRNSIFENGSITGKSNIEISCDMACKIGEAFGSQLPMGSKVLVGRDYDKSPRMIKRAFVGGLLATGVEVFDLRAVPPAVLRYNIHRDESIIAGAYFRKSLNDPASVEITLYNEEGLRLDGNSAKAVEKTFFKEDFRRVDYTEIGKIHDSEFYRKDECLSYKAALENSIDHKVVKSGGFRIAVDLMFGITKEVFPQIMTDLQIDNIMLNAYTNARKLANIQHYKIKSKQDISAIVKNLDLDMGILIYPHGQRLTLVTDRGEVLNKVEALTAVLKLIDMQASSEGKKMRVFLPTWAPDLMDPSYEHLMIKRGKYANFKASTLKRFDLIATVDGNYAFTEFSLHRDAMYASLKIMELLTRHNLKLSDIAKGMTHFFYHTCRISCPQSMKGKMMRKFLEYAKGRRASTVDGVKIWENDSDWILMIPDQYGEHLNLYIQATDKERGMKLHDTYGKMIEEWMQNS
jgi:mannose-1-phosphate guanylyltransferase/phosphomannomutase